MKGNLGIEDDPFLVYSNPNCQQQFEEVKKSNGLKIDPKKLIKDLYNMHKKYFILWQFFFINVYNIF